MRVYADNAATTQMSRVAIEAVLPSLDKVYGPLHVIYLFYLVSFFAAMIGVAVYAAKKKKLNSIGRMTVLISAFSVNIGVWFIEQIVKFDFELLSVSYIISELFLLGLHLVI